MAFEIGVVLEDWKSAMILPLCKGKGRRLNARSIEVLFFKA